MNWLDIVLIVIVAIFVIRGVIRGLFKEAFGVGGIVVGIILAINQYEVLGGAIQKNFSFLSLKIANLVSFTLIFLGIALIGGILGAILHNSLKRSFAREVEAGGGFLLGLAEGVLVCSIILILISVSPIANKFDNWIKKSTLAPHIMKVGPSVYDGLISVTPGKAKKFMEKLKNIDTLKELLPEKRKS